MTTLLGQKIGMTQIFAPDGATVGVSLVFIPRTYITAVKTEQRDGYSGVQAGCLAYADPKAAAKKIAKPQLGHLKKSNRLVRKLFEYRVSPQAAKELKVGTEISLKTFGAGEFAEIRGVSKGRGFAGVVKRHHFKGGPASHGHKDNLRGPGSIGAQQPQHVWPGTRMAGHMGAAAVFVKNVELVKNDPDQRVLVFKGPLPGALHGWLQISFTGKKAVEPFLDRKKIEITKSGRKRDKKGQGDKKDGSDKGESKSSDAKKS